MADPVELTPPTQNFRIFYDPSLTNALANAMQFARTVEADFQTLTRWFAINDGFGPNNRVTVNLIYKDGAGSNNRGYHDDSSTALNLNGAPFGTPVAQIIRMHFVAEFSEVLMDYNNQHGPTTWLAGSSHGEGLSQFCAYMMAPAGYNSFLWAQFREHMAADGRPPQLGGHHRVHRWRRLQLWMCVAVPVLSAYPAQPLHRGYHPEWRRHARRNLHQAHRAQRCSAPSAACSAGSIRTARGTLTCRSSIPSP